MTTAMPENPALDDLIAHLDGVFADEALPVTRAAAIEATFRHHFTTLVGNTAVAVFEPVTWDTSDEIGELPMSEHGWTYPMWMPADAPNYDPDFPLVVAFCAEVIDARTAHLDEEALCDYVDAVLYLLDLHITHWRHPDGTDRDVHAREGIVAAQVAADEPTVIDILAAVHDRG